MSARPQSLSTARQLAAVPVSHQAGGFFSLFGLPPTPFSDEALEALGRKMSETHPLHSGSIPSGYVYLGQFITHDVAKMAPVHELLEQPEELVNLTSPAVDLSNVYGRGFREGFVDQKTGKMKLGTVTGRERQNDLPRKSDGKALIPDERDDENLLVSQLHVQFLRLHNFFVDEIAAADPGLDADQLFAAAREQTILHYQQVVLYDYLDTVLDGSVWEYVIAQNRGSLWNPTAAEMARVPVEFSAAAFRFAHSMILTSYTVNAHRAGALKDLLRPDKHVPATHVVDWTFFFLRPGHKPSPFLNVSSPIDVNVPVKVPVRSPGGEALAIKDLQAGNRSSLPDAQLLVNHVLRNHPEVAAAARLRQLTPAELNPIVAIGEGATYREAPMLELLGEDYGFERKTPLWYYILAEAQATQGGYRLGPLGSLIVAEALRGLVYLSSPSVLRKPFESRYIEPTKDVHGRRCFRMTDLLEVAR
jgi:hypothetical protein